MSTTLWWMAYCTAVSAVLAMGAHALENGARAAGRGGRHAWLGAMVASVLIPVAAYFRPVLVEAASSPLGEITVAAATFGDAGPAVSSAAPLHPGIVLWATACLLVLAFVAYSYVSLARARRTWTESSVDGVRVLLSEDIGPAALGVVRSAIVLPRWVLTLEARARALMLLHEREHLRAWDPRVTLAGVLLVAVMPWNVCMWLMVRRLRLAIELDCDARVLARDPDPARYGAVLLEVGRRRSGGGFALSTLVEPRSQLERRIRLMAEWPGHRKTTRALALAGVAVLLTGTAYSAQSPLHAPGAIVIVDASVEAERSVATDKGLVAAGGPAASDTTRPRLLNRDEVRAFIARQTGLNAKGVMNLYVDTAGRARIEAPKAGTDVPGSFVEMAEKLAGVMRFSPAIVDGRKVSTWVTFAVSFAAEQSTIAMANTPVGAPPGYAPPPPPTINRPGQLPPPPAAPSVEVPPADAPPPPPPAPPAPDAPRVVPPMNRVPTPKNAPPPPPRLIAPGANSTSAVPPREPSPPTVVVPNAPPVIVPADTPPPRPALPPTPPTIESIADRPVFTPMSVPPRLTNKVDVARAVSDAYPPAMRDAGLGGTTLVWFLLDVDGSIKKHQIHRSSGYPLLDAAALKVVPVMRFTPAEMSGRPTPVWVQIPIVFAVT